MNPCKLSTELQRLVGLNSADDGLVAEAATEALRIMTNDISVWYDRVALNSLGDLLQIIASAGYPSVLEAVQSDVLNCDACLLVSRHVGTRDSAETERAPKVSRYDSSGRSLKLTSGCGVGVRSK